MARTIRHSSTGWYHVMNRGVASQPIVRDDADRRKFFEVLERAVDDGATIVHAYCLMTNHYHLLVSSEAATPAAAMKRLGQGYSQAFNRRHDRIGPVFAGRYHDVPVQSEAQLTASIRYIALNPIAIDRFAIDTYPWSSHGAIVGRTAPPWLSDEAVERFGSVDAYRRLIDDGRADAEQIVEFARLANDEVRGMRASRDRDARDLVLLLADAVDGDLATRLVATLGFTDPNATRTARHRARRRSVELAPAVERLLQVVGFAGSIVVPGSGDLR